MIRIRGPADWNRIADPDLRAWLREQHPFVDELGDEGIPDGPDAVGWLAVIESHDDIRALDLGVPSLTDLTAIDTWEWAEHNAALDTWTAVVIVTDGFGLAIAVPGSLVRDLPLEEALAEAACPVA